MIKIYYRMSVIGTGNMYFKKLLIFFIYAFHKKIYDTKKYHEYE